MKYSFLLACLLTAPVSFAQDYFSQVTGREAVITPKTMSLVLTERGSMKGDACQKIKAFMKPSFDSFKALNCDKAYSESYCSMAKDIAQDQSSSSRLNFLYGPVVSDFDIDLSAKDLGEMRLRAASELGLLVENTSAQVPTAENLKKAKLETQLRDASGFFGEVFSVLKLKPNIQVSAENLLVRASGRLEYCLLQEKSASVVGELPYEMKSTILADKSESQDLVASFKLVSADWNKLKNMKWKNPLHKVLYAGGILKDHSQKLKKKRSIEDLFDLFFDSGHDDEELVVYLKTIEPNDLERTFAPARIVVKGVNLQVIGE